MFGDASLFSIEGIDGAGKATCSRFVMKKLSDEGIKCSLISFPNYKKTFSSAIIEALLNDDIKNSNAYFASIAFAMDRVETISKFSDEVDVIILDRYVASNAAFQGTRVPKEQKSNLIEWVANLEFDKLKSPKPNLNFFLESDPLFTRKNIEKKDTRSYTPEKFDAYERDLNFQIDVYQSYLSICDSDLFGRWEKISTMNDQNFRPPEEISDDILELIFSEI